MTTQTTQSERVQTHKTTESEKSRSEENDGHATIAAPEAGVFATATSTFTFDFSSRPSTFVWPFRIPRGFWFSMLGVNCLLWFLQGEWDSRRGLWFACTSWFQPFLSFSLLKVYLFSLILFPSDSPVLPCFCFFSHSLLFSKLILHPCVILM